tara:strand:+ start:227 stop:697 length:471 start_codon:yes stop_codon:yes gene_type:complete
VKSIIQSLALILMLNSSHVIAQGELLRLSTIISTEESVFEPQIQRDVENLEDELIAIFNKSNTVEDFEITCLKETQNGSYFFRACDPAFLIKERQANSVAWRAGEEKLLTKEAIASKFRDKLNELDMAFSKMLDEDENAMQIANSLIALKGALNSE